MNILLGRPGDMGCPETMRDANDIWARHWALEARRRLWRDIAYSAALGLLVLFAVADASSGESAWTPPDPPDTAPIPAPELPAAPWWFGPGNCVPTKAFLATFAASGSHVLHWQKVDGPFGGVLQVWGGHNGDLSAVNPDWHVVIHLPNGLTCKLASGEDTPLRLAEARGEPA